VGRPPQGETLIRIPGPAPDFCLTVGDGWQCRPGHSPVARRCDGHSPHRASGPPPRPAAVTAAASSAPGTVAAVPEGTLAPGDGPGGDHLIQALLEAHTPRNLQSGWNSGRAVWLADITGRGRERWPAYFTTAGTSGYTDVRVQAAAAHATRTGQSEVTLLWAGTTPAGNPEAGLPATMRLAQQPDGTWEPVR
jgi:hypothetical protein